MAPFKMAPFKIAPDVLAAHLAEAVQPAGRWLPAGTADVVDELLGCYRCRAIKSLPAIQTM
jgi:hypothetical protein